jgi:transposase-like protein
MGQEISPLKRNWYSLEQKKDFLSAFPQSGLSIKKFCRHQGISEAAFHRWKKRYGDEPFRPRGLYSREQKLALIDKFKTAHTSVKEFCRRQGIEEKVFRKWQSRYKDSVKTNAGFARLQIHTGSTNSAGQLFAEVKGIKLYQVVSASYLKELVK